MVLPRDEIRASRGCPSLWTPDPVARASSGGACGGDEGGVESRTRLRGPESRHAGHRTSSSVATARRGGEPAQAAPEAALARFVDFGWTATW